MIDTVVGGCYRLVRPLGEGGMGTVYEALHMRLGGKVAIKILSPQHAGDPKFRDRFRREARAASQIHHPNVVQITDFGETPSGSVFFAMEMLEGHDLHYVLQKHAAAPFPWLRALHLLTQAADALAAAHRSGIVHRDVKPSNIFVLEGPGLQDFVKLLDFGIAKIVAPSATADSALVKNLTGTGEIFGTAKYMAPEQAYGGANDPRMDVYSLGVVAYELLTGRVPFTGQSSFEIITKHVYESPRPLRELRPELPAVLEAVVLRAMEKKPESRFETMEEFGRALRQASGSGSSIPSPRAHPATDADTMPRGRRNELLSFEPMPMQPAAAAHVPPAVAPVEVAPVVRKTIPAIGPTSLPTHVAGRAMPAPIPAAPPLGAHPFAVPSPAVPAPAAYPPSSLLAASSTDDLARVHAPTGPLARRRGSTYDDTGRDLAGGPLAPSSGTRRLAVLAVIGAIAVASSSATAVILVAGPDDEEPMSAEALALIPEPPVVELQPATAPAPEPEPEPKAVPPIADVGSPSVGNEPSITAEESPEVVAPVPALDVTAPPVAEPPASSAKPLSSKPPSSKPRPRPTASPTIPDPDPDGEIAQQIGREIHRKIRQDCWELGNGKEVVIKLEVGSDGRIGKKTIGAVGPLRACIEKAIGSPQFPAKQRPVTLSPTIGKCVEAYGSTVSRCK